MSWGQSNGTRAAEAQRAHLTSSNLLSAASICVGGAFRCCTRGTGIESLAATRTTEPSLRNPEPTMGFEKVDGQRMVTLTDTPFLPAPGAVRVSRTLLRRCRPARPGPRGGGLHARSVGPPPRAFSLVSGLRCCLLGRVRAAAYAAADSTHAPSGRRTADRRRADEGRHGRRARAGTPRGLSARYRAPLLALAGLGGASAPSFRLVAAGRGPRPPTATPPCSL